MIGVAIAFALVLGVGFLLSRHPVRAIPLNGAYGAVAGVAIVAIAFIAAGLLGISPRTQSPAPHRVDVRPPQAPTTPSAMAQAASELKAAYAANPNMAITCPHPLFFERTMHAAGIAVVPPAATLANASCRIHRRALRGQFALPATVQHREYFEAERYFEDFPIARLQCMQCNSWIETLHPYNCGMSTPWFPAPPPSLALRSERWLTSKAEVTTIASSASGRFTVVAAGIYNTPQEIAIWDVERCEPVVALSPHGVIRNVVWSPDERTLITGRGVLWSQGQGSPGPSLFVWDAATGTAQLQFGDDLFGVRGTALSPDGRMLLASGMLGKTAAEGSTLDLWDVATGKLLTRLVRLEVQEKLPTLPFFSGVAFWPDGSLALAACDLYTLPGPLRYDQPPLPWWWNRGVRAWRVSDGVEVDFLAHQPTPVRSLSIARDASRLVTSGARFGVWNLVTGSLLWDKINGHAPGPAATGDCALIARATGYQQDNHGPYIDAAVELYDGSNGELISLGLHPTTPNCIAFAAGGRQIIAGGQAGELRFWNWTPE